MAAEFDVIRLVSIDPRERSSATMDRAVIRASSDLQPCAGVVLHNACSGLAFGAVSVYLARAQGSGSVPSVSWELRARFGGAQGAEVIGGASGSLSKFSSWASEGSITHVSGRRVLGFELWAKHDGAEDIPCEVRFIVAPASVGAPWFVEDGALV